MEIRGNKEREHLILKYDDKSHSYIDITKEVFYLKDDNNSWYVGFRNNSKYYHIAKNKLLISIDPIKIDLDRRNVYINNKKNFDVYSIIKFNNLGYKIFLKDNKTIFVNKISIELDKVSIDCIDFNIRKSGNHIFDYYKTLSKYASDIAIDDKSIEHLLYNLYKKVDNVDDDSVLKAYTSNKIGKTFFDQSKLIYPFATNLSQMKAIRKTFENELSVISGPPGTGKTQVILNIICNAIINNMNIAVISNNNTAVENIFEKMKKEGLDFFLAYLGRGDNVVKFFSKTDNLERSISQLSLNNDTRQASDLANQLESLYKISNALTLLNYELFNVEEEFRHFKEIHEYVDCSKYFAGYKECDKYLKLKYYLLSLRKIRFFHKLKLKLNFKFKDLNITSIEDLIVYIEYMFFELKILNIKNKIEEKKKTIETNNIDSLNKELKETSRNSLNNYLLNKYKSMKNCTLNKDNYRNHFDQFISRYPVILSTTQSLLRNINYGFKFDLIIIDEATQSDLLTTLLTMNVTKKMVVVGDAKQLSQIDNQKIYDASLTLIHNYKIDKCYQYKDNSILQSVLALPCKVDNTLLKEHYRCDSRIIDFCNKKFYDGELIICTTTKDFDPLVIVHTVEGNHARKSPNGSGQYNDRETQEIIKILNKCKSKDVGIITPFKEQKKYIWNLIKEDYPYVEVDTIHGYQGRQKKIVILSTVVNDLNIKANNFITDFVTNNQLLNVAISRAIDRLYLVVSDKVYKSNNNTIAQFIDYIKYCCKETSLVEGTVVSIFDCLYNEQNKILQHSPCNKYVDSYAEAIVWNLLNQILKDYPDYSVQIHYRLNDLIKNYTGLNNDELNYVKHPKTHVDFLIFDKISYRPILCIEVDGTRYHDYAPRQIEHDKIKNRVLASNKINMLRLKTNQSGEIDKIKSYL